MVCRKPGFNSRTDLLKIAFERKNSKGCWSKGKTPVLHAGNRGSIPRRSIRGSAFRHESRFVNSLTTSRKATVFPHLTPIADRQSPITNHQSPITNHQSPITNHQSPIANHQSPITNYQSPITNHQSPIADACRLVVKQDTHRSARFLDVLKPTNVKSVPIDSETFLSGSIVKWTSHLSSKEASRVRILVGPF